MNLKIATIIAIAAWGFSCFMTLLTVILMNDMSAGTYKLLMILNLFLGQLPVIIFFIFFLIALNRRNFFDFSQQNAGGSNNNPQNNYRRY
jgi:predicted anti-sigma-YlaC factor YlaD